MSKCISVHGEYSEHEYTTKPTCDYCGQISEMLAIVQNEDFRSALVAIQEHHVPVIEDGIPVGCLRCDWEVDGAWPCKTRKLADEGLGGGERG
ncbi:hypothetical protein ABZ820_33340 [Streptomyces diacarni]|uniref:hypothetical protein n=1 Tax=Streptomyces diacarni TaxID=2800381 RepID=UPI0033EC352D